jgi:zinc transporter ZupT
MGAGAMIFVVADDLIPEAQEHGNGRTASIGCMVWARPTHARTHTHALQQACHAAATTTTVAVPCTV